MASHSMSIITTTSLLLVLVASTSGMSGQFTTFNRACRVVALDSCSRTLALSIPSFFRSGEEVVLHQAVSSDLALVGSAEFNVVDTIIGPYAYLRYALLGRFDAYEHLQLVRVIHATELNDATHVHAIPWNGEFGGVLVLSADDTLRITTPIIATTAGFRGNVPVVNDRDTVESAPLPTTEGALPTRHGAPRNGGGHGGSVVSLGGRGGSTTTAFLVRDSQYADGPRVLPSRDTSRLRVYLGSAGGSGHQNDLRGGKGGTGGGAVLIKAPVVIAATAATIDVSGRDGEDAIADGAGGGGSGGSITLLADTLIGTIWCDLSGGVGGSTRGTVYRYGPGGGGGGGMLQVANIGLLKSLQLQRSGGASGGSQIDTSTIRTSHGAQPGSEGVIRVINGFDKSSHPPLPPCVIAGNDTIINGRVFWAFRTTCGLVHKWYLDTAEVRGSAVVFVPADTNITRISADVEIDGCRTRVFTDLPANPAAGDELRVIVDQLRANVGDTVAVFIRVERANAQSSLRGTISLRLYQPVLIPVERRYRSATRYTTIEIPFTLAREARSTFRRVEAIAVLGDSASIQLGIDTVIVTPASVRVQTTHGRLTINDICVTDRTRLFDQGSNIRIEGRSIAIRAEEAVVVNLLGQMIARMRSGSGDGWLTSEIPDHVGGMCFIVATRNGQTTTHSIFINP